MKFFKSSILAMMALAVSFTACSDDDNYVEANATPGLFFPASIPADMSVNSKYPDFTIEVNRTGESGAATYGLVTEYDSDIFTVPSSVSFAEGESTSEITISYNLANWDFGTPASMKIAFAEGVPVNNFGQTSLDLTLTLEEPWKSLGQGEFRETFITTLYGLDDYFDGVEHPVYACEVQESEVTPGFYRIVNPYGPTSVWQNFFETELSTNYMYFELVDNDPNKVILYPFSTAIALNSSEGGILGGSIAYCLRYNGEAIPAAYYGSISDGVLTFPASTLIAGLTGEGSDVEEGTNCFIINADSQFAIAMPGARIADYDVAATYNGLVTGIDGKTSVSFNITLGADLTGADLALIPGRDSEAALNDVESASVDVLEIENTGKAITVTLPASEMGANILAIIGKDNGNNAARASFPVMVQGAESNWEDFGTATFIDGWFTAAYTDEYQNYAWAVPVQRNTKDKNLIRLVAPYNQPSSIVMIQGWNENLAPSYITIDITDPTNVLIEPQFAYSLDMSVDGFGIADIFVGNAAGYFYQQGCPREQIEAVLAQQGLYPNELDESGFITIEPAMFGGYGSTGEDINFGNAWRDDAMSMIYIPALDQNPAASAPRLAPSSSAKDATFGKPSFKGGKKHIKNVRRFGLQQYNH